MRRAAIWLALAGLAAGAQVARADDGATIYKRCAACHLADGAGGPARPLRRHQRNNQKIGEDCQ